MTSIPNPPIPTSETSTRKSHRWPILVTLVSSFVLMAALCGGGVDVVGNRYGDRAFGGVIALLILGAISGLVFAVTLLIAVVVFLIRPHSGTEELRLTTLPPLLPDVPEAKESRYKPILITLLCAYLLAGGSCFGFLSTLSMNGGSSPVNSAFAIGFGLSLLVFLAGIVWLIATWIRSIGWGK